MEELSETQGGDRDFETRHLCTSLQSSLSCGGENQSTEKHYITVEFHGVVPWRSTGVNNIIVIKRDKITAGEILHLSQA